MPARLLGRPEGLAVSAPLRFSLGITGFEGEDLVGEDLVGEDLADLADLDGLVGEFSPVGSGALLPSPLLCDKLSF